MVTKYDYGIHNVIENGAMYLSTEQFINIKLSPNNSDAI